MWRRAGLVSLLFIVLTLLIPVQTYAGVNDFIINSFDANYELTNQDKQGRLKITEKIEVDFSDNNHGILRAIPLSDGKTKTPVLVTSVLRDGVSEPYSTYKEDGNLVLKIGNPNFTVTGKHNYEIKYQVNNVIRFYDDHVELYWDINGDQWYQTIEKVSVNITPPEGLPFEASPPPACYTGRYKSTSSDCQFNPPTSGVGSSTLNLTTTKALQPKETLTFIGALPKGYFTPAPWWENFIPFLPIICLLLLQLFIGISAFFTWLRYGKDHPEKPVDAVAFEVPKGLTPLTAGYLYDQSLLPKHCSAALIDLAIRGYIQITESDKKGVIKKKSDYSLKLLKEPVNLTRPEKELVLALFPTMKVNDTADLGKKSQTLAKNLTTISTFVEQELNEKGLYDISPKQGSKFLGKQTLVAVMLIFVSFFLTSIFTPIAIVSSFALIIFLITLQVNMKRRSKSGVEIKDQLDGLKIYLSTAEKDRMKLLQGANAPLAENSQEPVRTVKLFEKLLPYAIIFGVEKTWAEAFKDIYTEPPQWFSGNWTAFNTGLLIGSLNNSVNAMATSFTAPSSSGSSGFSSGGGFSGGGGGGGGGGGW